MRAAKMKERPSFQLMVQTDVQSIYHMQMPRWLFSDPRYCEMSLDAKVTYTFLLNRLPALAQERMGQRARRGLRDLSPQGSRQGAADL